MPPDPGDLGKFLCLRLGGFRPSPVGEVERDIGGMFTRITVESIRRLGAPAILACSLALAGCSSLGTDDAGVAQTSTTVENAITSTTVEELPATTLDDRDGEDDEAGSTTTVLDQSGDDEDETMVLGEREELPVTGPNDILIATVFGLLLLIGGRSALDAEGAIRRRLARRHAVMPPR